ncbi:MAG: AsnC family transcriptional regulator [Armatimonadetes bacterium]|nr:AsnC family transcriptional regulator [Armatimonadota bacterium]
MDYLDRQLLNIIQVDFPIASRPYQILGERLGISESEVLERVHRLFETGIIRKIGPSFDTRRLGHVSILVAARVPEERVDEVAHIISSYPQVTHNYGRESEYNLWFTLICRDEGEMNDILESIKSRTGISEMHMLPAERTFKIKVEFEF